MQEEIIPILYTEGDEPVHTDAHPYCTDTTCPCHESVRFELLRFVRFMQGLGYYPAREAYAGLGEYVFVAGQHSFEQLVELALEADDIDWAAISPYYQGAEEG